MQHQQQQEMYSRSVAVAAAATSATSAATLPLSSSTALSFEWPTVATSYELLGKIGQGAFATVWKARTKIQQHQHHQHGDVVAEENAEIAAGESNESAPVIQQEPQQQQQQQQQQQYEYCAIKVLNLDHVDSDLQEIRLEVQAMRLSSHANVLQCCTAFCENVHLWLVTPLMRKGSSLYCLQSIRRNRRKRQLQSSSPSALLPPSLPPLSVSMEDFIVYIIRESLLGLQYIHDNGQIHRDIKAGNSESSHLCMCIIFFELILTMPINGAAFSTIGLQYYYRCCMAQCQNCRFRRQWLVGTRWIATGKGQDVCRHTLLDGTRSHGAGAWVRY
jgi:serine/threonine protein kinase